jgi:hypothetical protein
MLIFRPFYYFRQRNMCYVIALIYTNEGMTDVGDSIGFRGNTISKSLQNTNYSP